MDNIIPPVISMADAPPTKHQYISFDEADINISPVVKDVLNNIIPNLYGGAIVAGGALLADVAGYAANDIDIFCVDPIAANESLAAIIGVAPIEIDESTRFVNYDYKGTTLQLICFNTLDHFDETSVRKLMDSFDLEVCMVSVNPHNPQSFIAIQDWFQQVATKRLKYNPSTTSNPLGTFIRIQKYSARGFFMKHLEIIKFYRNIANSPKLTATELGDMTQDELYALFG